MYIDTANNKSAQKTYGVIRKDDEVIITEVIKIYTTEQLLAINSEKEPNHSEYFRTYILMNDIRFKVSDFEIDYWKPIGEIEIVDGQFEGNDKAIHVTYLDSDNEEYTIVYNKENNYSEIEYEFTIKTFVVDKEERTSADEYTKIFDITNESDIKEIGKTILVKRGAPNFKKVQAEIDSISFKPSNEAVIEVENPAKINPIVELLIEFNYINLKVQVVEADNGSVDLTDKATVKINDKVLTKEECKNGVSVVAGLELSYTTECSSYKNKER